MSSPSRKRDMVKAYFSNKYDKVLDSLLVADTTAALAHGTGVDSSTKKIPNMDVVHGIASSLFNASVERLKAEKNGWSMSSIATESSDDFWKDENFKQETNTDEGSTTMESVEKTAVKIENKTREHFVDLFVEKLIARMIPDKLPEREHFGELSEEERRKAQTVSATVLSSNLKKLTPKMPIVFELQDSIVRLLTWRNPSGTVTMLILCTMICYNPMYLITMPLLYIAFGLMVPGYIRRHPLRRALYPVRRVYGRSLIEEIADSGARRTSGSASIHKYSYNGEAAESGSPALEDPLSNRVEFVSNLRDFQTASTATVQMSNSLERFLYGTAGFKDERHSTVVFLKYIFWFCFLGAVSKFVNWSFVLSAWLWYAMIKSHPKVKKKLEAFKTKGTKTTEVKPKKEGLQLILDEPPEVKLVEIYEIYKQGITPRHWDFYKYSNQVFDPLDKYRKLQQPPPGVDNLNDVYAPSTWVFDENSAWDVDWNVKKWANERGLQYTTDGEFLVDDMFKRRRLTRRVLRYANPVIKPSYKK
ncbi:hypothetical protein HG536_0A01260 [Torulaspora globosa]|uniref:TECPR1-like DysF domain-containing protein n=1 Tax=Torulaspora globosa TaxID=48254 RepID=A0A7G3Z9X3_9SACH|nr:uncharacterized protein HG536_0A01260 [Torulaspora globosa]QLL30309.1 hypothetical protein HG536_0A01260 [Torulaspora globosa]